MRSQPIMTINATSFGEDIVETVVPFCSHHSNPSTETNMDVNRKISELEDEFSDDNHSVEEDYSHES